MSQEVLFPFASTAHAIAAEQALLPQLNVRVMNLPSSIRAGCGICLRVDVQDAAKASALLRQAGIPHEPLYLRETHGGGTLYTPYPL